MGFRTDLVGRARVGTARVWCLELPLVYEADSGETIIVPPGFLTDLASIPQLAQAIYPVNDKHRPAAGLHDYLYTIQDRSRAAADLMFLEAMAACDVRWTQRRVMYRLVRLGGWNAWNKNAHSLAENPAAHYAAHGLMLDLDRGRL